MNLPGGQNRVFVIAEIASCHGGDRQAMSEAIRVAKDAGADAIKFQWTSSPERLAARRHAEEYLWAYRTLAFPQEWLADLKAECDGAGIEFMCTVYLPEDIPVIAPLVKWFKVASFEAGDRAFLKAHAPFNKTLWISTGMATTPDVERIRTEMYCNPSAFPCGVKFLHCISGYPAPLAELNLWIVRDLSYAGFSDHSANILTGLMATTAGARILEVHFRLASTDHKNPDYLHSLAPPDLVRYIANVRLAEAALGDGQKRVMPSEERWTRYRVRA